MPSGLIGRVDVLATDRHPQLSCYMKKRHSHILITISAWLFKVGFGFSTYGSLPLCTPLWDLIFFRLKINLAACDLFNTMFLYTALAFSSGFVSRRILRRNSAETLRLGFLLLCIALCDFEFLSKPMWTLPFGFATDWKVFCPWMRVYIWTICWKELVKDADTSET